MNKKLFERKNFLWRTFTFSGYITPGRFWSELGMRAISFFCATIILCIVLSVTVPGDTEDVMAAVDIAVPILGLLWLIPCIALSRRRLRDAGYGPKAYLWLLLPLIGWLIFIVLMFAGSKPQTDINLSFYTSKLGIDLFYRKRDTNNVRFMCINSRHSFISVSFIRCCFKVKAYDLCTF